MRKACVLLLAFFLGVSGSGSLPAARPRGSRFTETGRGTSEGIANPNLDARVEFLLHSMTLEEKVGQLVHILAGQATGPGTGAPTTKT